MVFDESRAKRSGLPYVGFGGVEVVGRGADAIVGGFEGVVDAQRSAKESLIVVNTDEKMYQIN